MESPDVEGVLKRSGPGVLSIEPDGVREALRGLKGIRQV